MVLIGLVLLLLAGLSFAVLTSSRSTNYSFNLTVAPRGAGNATSDNYDVVFSLGGLSGNVSSSNYQVCFGFLCTTNKSGVGVVADLPNITVYVWNGSEYNSGFGISFDCRPGQNNCEPVNQNATPINDSVNRGIMNITNTGDPSISLIEFKINATCSSLNFTFTNSTDLVAHPRQTLNTTLKTLYGSLGTGDSFDFFVYINVTGNPAPTSCGVIDTKFEVT